MNRESVPSASTPDQSASPRAFARAKPLKSAATRADVVTCATAFAALVIRYTREPVVVMALSPGDDAAPLELRVEASLDEPLRAIAARLRAQLGARWAGPVARLSWTEGDAALSLVVRLDDARVDLAASRTHGLSSARAPLAAAARHFALLERAVAERATTTLREVALVVGAERRRVDAFATGDAADTAPELLHEIFEASARDAPARIAVEHGDARVTYGELDARSGRLAGALRARGIGPGAFVALRLPRSIDLYVAMLAVLKAGAAYVPLDAEWPHERVAWIIADCGAAAVLTLSSLPDADAHTCMTIALDRDRDSVRAASARARAPTPSDVAYVIYTSGSTGRPKGVMVEHRSVAHLVRVEQRLFATTPCDRVLQGFSPAFDAAVEEVWLAFAAGATLVAASKDALLDDFAGFVTRERVSVVSTVPTLLASVDADLPSVRMLIVGGEVCPQSLVDRWATGPRAMFNTYGPTEATVIATSTRLRAGARATIGRPIPGYRVDVVDAAGQPAPLGMVGEIVVGGPGVARGYVGAPALTASKFVHSTIVDGRAYRTGDLGRFDDDGNIEFCGRVDDQVKLRGFRIELGEIEAAILATKVVSSAVVVVREDAPGGRELVAYVVAHGAWPPDALAHELRRTLPPYMVPSHVEVLSALPTLTSGKVDRRALPPPRARTDAPSKEAPRGRHEEAIARVWSAALGVASVGRDDHFFHDLGGHSLLAAQAVSRLRREPAFASLSVLDLYEHPSIAALAARARPSPTTTTATARPLAATGRGFYACAAAQAAALYAIFGVYSSYWLAPYLAYASLGDDISVGVRLAASAIVVVAVHPLLLLVALAAKWLVVGRYRPGRYPLWGAYYLRFWIVDRLLAIAPTAYLVGTPLLAWYYRLLGARIGDDVHLASDDVRCFDLVSIGDGSTLGAEASMTGYAVEDGALVLGGARLGRGCTVGARALIAPGATLYDGASLAELSMLPQRGAIPAGERWAGSPARPAGRSSTARRARASRLRRCSITAAYAAIAALMPVLIVAALLPGLAMLHALDARFGAWSLALSPLVAAMFVAGMCVEIALVKWVVVGRTKAGAYDLWSGTVLRHWVVDRAMAMSLDLIGGLYATLYLNPWYRLLGAKVGARAEISTATSVVPDLLRIDDESFVADCVSLGAPRIEGGALCLAEVRVGARAFVGNSAVVTGGSVIGGDALVGCLSVAPTNAHEHGAWFGSPPIALPQRQASAAFPASRTYRPPRALVLKRLAYEALRVTLPTACFVALTCLLVDAAVALSDRLPLGAFIAVFPLLYAAFGIAAALLVVGLKWAVVGRFRAGEHPLWSSFVWRTELVTAMHENLADPFFNQLLRGTPFAAWFFRALGAKIGRRVHLGTTQLTEYDLVTVGDDACIGEDATLQTHLFEDRVMKVARVSIGERCTVGAQSIVLYDTTMEAGARLAPLSLLMKGETLPRESAWAGSPARAA